MNGAIGEMTSGSFQSVNWVKDEAMKATVNKKLIRRWDSERELSLRWHHICTTKYNRLVHKFRYRSTRLCWNTFKYTKFSKITNVTAIMSFKVTNFGTNRNTIYDFLSVINTNLSLPPILHRSKLWLIIGQIFANESGVPHFNVLAGGDPLPISP